MGSIGRSTHDVANAAASLTAIATLVIGLMVAACAPLPGPGRMYACGGPQDGHCYGIARFHVVDLGGSDFQSFSTTIDAVALLGGNGEINDEFWVKQQLGPRNCGEDPNICWVEVGLSAGACTFPANETHVFWADNRPFGNGYVCHDMGPLQHNEFGQPAFLLIRVNPSDPSDYDVAVLVCAAQFAQCQPRWLVGQSTNNAMAPDTIDMGMELSGSTGAAAPGTTFSGTMVTVSGISKFLDIDGVVGANPPINAGWDSRPGSGNGGSFRTSCCF